MKQSEERYRPGSRKNSFFEDMPVATRERKHASVEIKKIFEYTYYIGSDGSMIKEKLK